MMPWVDLDLFYDKVKFGRLCSSMGKTVTKSFNEKSMQERTITKEKNVYEKRIVSGGCLSCPGAIYMYITIIFKHFSQTTWPITTWPIKAKFHVEQPLEGGMRVCINGLDHITKMATTPIYGKNL